MLIKKGTSWKAGCNEEKELYGAQVVFQGDLTMYEISAETFEKLNGKMSSSEAEKLIKEGRKLYMRMNDRNLPPSTIIIDDDYMEYCPWLEKEPEHVGRVWSEKETDFFVEIFEPENNREQRRRKREERKKKES